MKKLLLIVFFSGFASVQGFSQIIKKLRIDGLYQSKTDKDDCSRRFLRFYSDSTVLSTTSIGQVTDVIKWLKKPYEDKGRYEIKEGKIYFATTSSYGTIIYEGDINSEYKLTLKTKSLINGHESEEVYYFIKI